jgi:flagellin-like protein
MVSTKRNEEAVSPVIGVILMVAVTVILAAIIAAFVFGMAGNVQTTKVVAFTAKMDGTDVTVTSMGGNDYGKLESVAATVNNAAVSGPSKSIGVTSTLSTGTAGQNHVVLVGTFNDGTQQVILDTTV